MQKFRYIFWKKCFLKIRKMTNKNWSPSLIFIKKIRKIPQIFNTEKWLKIRKFFVSFLSGSSQELTSLMLWKFEWKQVAIFFFANSAVSYTTAKNQWGKATRQLWISFGSILTIFYFRCLTRGDVIDVMEILLGSYYMYWSYYTYCLNFFD